MSGATRRLAPLPPFLSSSLPPTLLSPSHSSILSLTPSLPHTPTVQTIKIIEKDTYVHTVGYRRRCYYHNYSIAYIKVSPQKVLLSHRPPPPPGLEIFWHLKAYTENVCINLLTYTFTQNSSIDLPTILPVQWHFVYILEFSWIWGNLNGRIYADFIIVFRCIASLSVPYA